MENKITEVAYIEALTAASLKGNEIATAELVRIGMVIFPSKITTHVTKKTASKKPATAGGRRVVKKTASKKPATAGGSRVAKKTVKKKSAATKRRNAAIEKFKQEKHPIARPQRTLQQLIDEVNDMQ